MRRVRDREQNAQLIWVAVIVTILGFLGSGFEVSDLVTTSHVIPVDPAAQIQTDIRTALDKNSKATSFHDWVKAGYLPASVFRGAQQLLGEAELCETLKNLSSEELSLFANQVEAFQAPCRDQLITRLEKFWEARSTHLKEVWSFSTEPTSRPVSFCFHGGPHERTHETLLTLKRYGIKATFFVEQARALEHPDRVQEILKDGHQVGMMATDQDRAKWLTIKDAKRLIADSREAMNKITNSNTDGHFAFHFPGGAIKPHLADLLDEAGLSPHESHTHLPDWQIRDPLELLDKSLTLITTGQISVVALRDELVQTQIVLPYLIEEVGFSDPQQIAQKKQKGFKVGL